MAKVVRIDSNKLGSVRRTPAGGVVVSAYATRAGVFEYRTSEGKTVREYRDPDEVFKPDSMATYDNATVTERHPRGMVDPSNWAMLTKGHIVCGTVKQDGDHLALDVAVNDGLVIGKIDRGELSDLSVGYKCDLIEEPGVVPAGKPDAGQRYDRRQANIECNHLALLPKGKGRAGDSVRLRLDAAGNACFDPPSRSRPRRTRTPTMKLPQISYPKRGVCRIDGVTFTLRTPRGRKQAHEALSGAQKRLKDAFTTERADDETSPADEAVSGLLDLCMQLQTGLHAMMASSAHESKIAAEAETAVSEDAEDKEPEDGERKPPTKDAEDKEPEEKTKDAEDKKPEEKMDAAVEERMLVIDKARALHPKIDTKGKSTVAIMKEALVHHDKTLTFDSASEVRGAFLVVKPHTQHPSLGRLQHASRNTGRADETDEKAAPSSTYKDRLAGAWKRK